MMRPTIALAAMSLVGPVAAQQITTPSDLGIDAHRFVPHRIELRNDVQTETGWRVANWQYQTFELEHAWDRVNARISELNLGWNGTGPDIMKARGDNLALLDREAPASIPNGLRLASHYGDSVIMEWALPHGIWQEETIRDTLYVKVPDSLDTPTLLTKWLEHPEIFTYRIWPYVISQLNLGVGESLVMPGYSMFRDSQYYSKLTRVGDTVITDERGFKYNALVYQALSSSSAQEAIDMTRESSENHVEWYVSPSAPYYLGYQRFADDSSGVRSPTIRSVLTNWETIRVGPSNRIEDIRRARREWLNASNEQVLWWND